MLNRTELNIPVKTRFDALNTKLYLNSRCCPVLQLLRHERRLWPRAHSLIGKETLAMVKVQLTAENAEIAEAF